LKALQSIKGLLAWGVTLGLIATRANARVPIWMNPMARIVHPKPMVGSSVLAMLGKTSPPTVLPQAAIANATARFVVK
jgi:hypothetical protein